MVKSSSYDAKTLYKDLRKRLEALETLWPELKGQAVAIGAGVQAGVASVIADTKRRRKRSWSKAQKAAASKRMRTYHARKRKAGKKRK